MSSFLANVLKQISTEFSQYLILDVICRQDHIITDASLWACMFGDFVMKKEKKGKGKIWS